MANASSQNLGMRFTLYSLLGWLKTSPQNRSQQELDIAGKGRSHGMTNGIGSQYSNYTTGNSDPRMHAEEMAEMLRHEVVAPVVDLYSEEATVPDLSNNRTLWYECDDQEVEDDLNNMLDRIRIEDSAYSIVFNIAGFGDDFQRVMRTVEDGIVQLIPVSKANVKRIYDFASKRLLGFAWQGFDPVEEQGISLGAKQTPVWAPWEFIHFRRLSRRGTDSDSEYGTSMVEHLFSLYRRIKLSVDQMVMYRLHVMPSRWVCWIDTGSQTVSEQMDTVNAYRNFLRASVAVNEHRFDSRFNPPAMDSILFMPKPTGDESKIDIMNGSSDVPDVPDLDTLFKMFYGGARVPRAYLGFDDDNNGLSNSSLVTKDMRFARTIKALRKPFMQGMHRLGEFQLCFKGKDPSQYKIRVMMSKISALEEEVRAATMEKQGQLASTIIDICQRLTIPNKEIIELVFAEFLQLPRDFVDIAKLAASVQQAVGLPIEQGEGGGMGGPMGGGMPMGGGGLGTDLGLEPEPGGNPEGAPDVELTTDKAGAGKQESQAQFKRNAVLLFESSLVGRGNEIKLQMVRMQKIVRDLGRIHASKKSSLVECYSSSDLSTRATEPLPPVMKPATKGGTLTESTIKNLIVESAKRIAKPYEASGEFEVRTVMTTNGDYELNESSYETGAIMTDSIAKSKTNRNQIMHESVQTVTAMRAKSRNRS
jgi:hypothetical protein